MVNGTEDLGFFWGGRGSFIIFYFIFFGENDRHLLHYIEQVHPEEIEA